jgi:hypothetical protein
MDAAWLFLRYCVDNHHDFIHDFSRQKFSLEQKFHNSFDCTLYTKHWLESHFLSLAFACIGLYSDSASIRDGFQFFVSR